MFASQSGSTSLMIYHCSFSLALCACVTLATLLGCRLTWSLVAPGAPLSLQFIVNWRFMICLSLFSTECEQHKLKCYACITWNYMCYVCIQKVDQSDICTYLLKNGAKLHFVCVWPFRKTFYSEVKHDNRQCFPSFSVALKSWEKNFALHILFL